MPENGYIEENPPLTCNVGDIYYSDDTCSADVVSGKTPIGVVFDAVNKLVVSLDEASGKAWGPNEIDVAQLSNYGTWTAAQTDFNGKSNTDILVSLGTQYEAANYCHNMTTGGKTWYLPALGEMQPMSNSAVQSTVSAVGTAFSGYCKSSTEQTSKNAWILEPFDGESYNAEKYAMGRVRCIFKY